MKHFDVTGMSCAACSAHVEKAVCKLEGVDEVSVSLLTNSMNVEGSASAEEIIEAVEKAGYGASLKTDDAGSGAGGDGAGGTSGADGAAAGGTAGSRSRDGGLSESQHREFASIRNRLIASLVFLIPLMYVSMGHMMWNWPLPAAFAENHVAMGLFQMLFTIIIMVINQKFFISGFTSFIHRAPNMDTLVAMGAGAAFGYSTYVLFAMTDAQMRGDHEAVMGYMHEFYFESAAMILSLITVGKMLEAYSKGKTTNALKSLMALKPQQATILENGKEITVGVERVKRGDTFVVRPGESIPVDGVILEGESAVDESAISGESVPVDKAPGDEVTAATINASGFLTCEATRVGADMTLSKIIQMVTDAAASKAPIAKVADKVSGIFVPTVLVIAAVTVVIWLLAGQTFGFALARGISVLVISCPCALGLATPVAIMVGSGLGAKRGILFKNATALEAAGRTKTVVLDKTGTITQGEPRVTDVLPAEGVSPRELLTKACSMEAKSEHPLAKALVVYAEEQQILLAKAEQFANYSGSGVSAQVDGVTVYGGKLEWTEEKLKDSPEELAVFRSFCKGHGILELAKEGKTPLFFLADRRLLGAVAVADQIKPESPQAIREMKEMGIEVVMLTGDRKETAEAIGRAAGVSRVIAGVLPDGKEQAVAEFARSGQVMMVGDGINDAPALTRAEVGVAIGAGTDVAIDAADVVLVNSKLSDVPAAIRLSRGTLRNIHENLFWAFIYNIIGIPLAAGLWIPVFGWEMNPMFGAAAMSLSSVCVVTNALRLNLLDIYDSRKFRKKHKDRGTQMPVIQSEEDSPQEAETPETMVRPKETELQEKMVRPKKTEIPEVVVHLDELDLSHGLLSGKGTENKEKENETMEKKMTVNGMMCGHCEARVKQALEAIDGVSEAKVSHEANEAVVTLSAEVSDDALTKAVVDAGYEVAGIEN